MSNQTTQFRSEIKFLLQAALLIFTFTVAIGILNGHDIIDFERKQLMSHVHAGTLGWITLGFVAACLWIFRKGKPPLVGEAAAHAGSVSPPLCRAFTLTPFTLAISTCVLIGGLATRRHYSVLRVDSVSDARRGSQHAATRQDAAATTLTVARWRAC